LLAPAVHPAAQIINGLRHLRPGWRNHSGFARSQALLLSYFGFELVPPQASSLAAEKILMRALSQVRQQRAYLNWVSFEK
jgi:hypothetical protein